MRTFARPAAIAAAVTLSLSAHAIARADEIAGGATEPGPSLKEPRAFAQAVTLDDGRVLVLGGFTRPPEEGPRSFAREAELYDPVLQEWTTVSAISGPEKGRMLDGRVVVGRTYFQATKLRDGRVLVTGGFGFEMKDFFGVGIHDKIDTLSSVHVFDPRTNVFQKVGDLRYARHSHTATLQPDGSVLIVGGYGDEYWRERQTAPPIEVWREKDGLWEGRVADWHDRPSEDVRFNRQDHVAIRVGDATLVVGGRRWTSGGLFGLVKSKMAMNDETCLLSLAGVLPSGSLAHARLGHGAALLGSGKVVVAGGHDVRGLIAEIETWDPATTRWTSEAKLAHPRTFTNVVAAGPKAAVIGGCLTSGSDVREIDVFDERTGQVTSPLRLREGRLGCVVTRLADGRVLVIGGFSGAVSPSGRGGWPLQSTELFDLR